MRILGIETSCDETAVAVVDGGRRIVPEGVPVIHPAFDVTPNRLITAIITERGIVRPPYEPGLLAICGSVAAAGTRPPRPAGR